MTRSPIRTLTSTLFAAACLVGLGAGANAGPHDDHKGCPRLSPEERAELHDSLRDLGHEMGRLGAEIAREVASALEDVDIEGGDWAELEDEMHALGEEIREEVERELKDSGVKDHVRERMRSDEWHSATREMQGLVREIVREARLASLEAARAARDAAREARQGLHERHQESDHID